MSKIVRYNGGTKSYYGCSDPATLVVGKEYKVVNEHVREWQTDYTLEGVEGEFNSVWFDTLYSEKPTFMAVAHKVPVVGERCQCHKLEFVNGYLKLTAWNTSIVEEVLDMGNNIYHTTTHNSVYIVKVG